MTADETPRTRHRHDTLDRIRSGERVAADELERMADGLQPEPPARRRQRHRHEVDTLMRRDTLQNAAQGALRTHQRERAAQVVAAHRTSGELVTHAQPDDLARADPQLPVLFDSRHRPEERVVLDAERIGWMRVEIACARERHPSREAVAVVGTRGIRDNDGKDGGEDNDGRGANVSHVCSRSRAPCGSSHGRPVRDKQHRSVCPVASLGCCGT